MLSFIFLTSCQFGNSIIESKISVFSVSSSDEIVMVNGTSYFTARGGRAPYTYSISSGMGTIDSSTGLFTAAPISGPVVIEVHDSVGHSALHTLTVIESLSISPSTLALMYPIGLDVPLPATTGGYGPLSFLLTSGLGTVDSVAGNYRGPLSWGSSSVEIRDSFSNSVTLTINNRPVLFDGYLQKIVEDSTHYYVGGDFSRYAPFMMKGLGILDPSTGDPTNSACNWSRRLNGSVYALFDQGDSLYIGGSFNTYDGTTVQNLIKINSSTCVLDTTFTQTLGFGSTVTSITGDVTSIYVGGYFTTYRGSSANYIAKLNKDNGDLDTTFTQALGFDSVVESLLVVGSDIFAGGAFSTYRGVTVPKLAKLNISTGNLDGTFPQNTGLDDSVRSLVSDGIDLYIGGQFTTYLAQTALRLAKVNVITGALDTTFTQATGTNSYVISLYLDGLDLYVGGWFNSYRGQSANYLAKVNKISGDLDTTFTQATGFNSYVNSITKSGSNLFVGGQFALYRGVASNYLAKIDATSGNLDSTFNQSVGFNGLIRFVKIIQGNVAVGGGFTAYRGEAVQSLAKINKLTGELDRTFTQTLGVVGAVNDLEIDSTGLYVAGLFSGYRGTFLFSRSTIFKLDLTTGDFDTSFHTGSDFGIGNIGHDIELTNDSVYVAGYLAASYRGGTYANGVAKLDKTNGNLDTTFNSGFGSGCSWGCLALSLKIVGNDLYLGGNFLNWRGTGLQRLAKLDRITGNLDATFSQASGFDGQVRAIESDGTGIYIGGNFSTYRGVTVNRLVKVDSTNGAIDGTFTQVTGFDGDIYTLQLNGGHLYVGGGFATYRGTSSPSIAKLNPTNGNLDTVFTPSTETAMTIENFLFSGSHIYVIGNEANRYRGEDVTNIIRLNKTTGDPD